MSEGYKTVLRLIGIALIYGVAWVAAYRDPMLQLLWYLFSATAFVLNCWVITSALRKWEQPERTVGSISGALFLTIAETVPPFCVAASLYGV